MTNFFASIFGPKIFRVPDGGFSDFQKSKNRVSKNQGLCMLNCHECHMSRDQISRFGLGGSKNRSKKGSKKGSKNVQKHVFPYKYRVKSLNFAILAIFGQNRPFLAPQGRFWGSGTQNRPSEGPPEGPLRPPCRQIPSGTLQYSFQYM